MSSIKRSLSIYIASCFLAFLTTAADPPPSDDTNRYWPQWRGPLGSGVAPTANPPQEWSEEKNIRWKLPLPGKGHSTPIIWGDRIYITAAKSFGDPEKAEPDRAPGAHDNLPSRYHHEFVVLAVSRHEGNIIWQQIVRKERPHEGGHFTGSLASNSPVTDGEHLFAFFGSRGLYCLDLEGNRKWERDFGNLQTRHAHGEGSSPALYGDTLIINWDHQGQSYVYAIDKQSGKQLWQVEREEITSWSSPLIIEHGDTQQVIISATNRVRSYDLKTGDVIWECGGLSRNVVASPVASDGLVVVANSYDGQAMLAIRLDGATGDITGSDQIAWTRNRHTPYVPSPLLYEENLYFLKHNQGLLSCLTAKTGKKVYGPIRLNGIRNVFASPVGAANRVYITDRDGVTVVLKHGAKPIVLAVNQLNDRFSASPAIVDRELYLRGERNLYCIVED